MNPQQPQGFPPQYQQYQPLPGHGAPRPPHSRWLVPVLTAAAGLVAGGIIVGAATSGPPSAGPAPAVTVTATPAAPQGYHDPAILESALKGILARRLANPSGQYYAPGVTVKSVLCVETSKTAATCLYKLSGGQSDTDSVVISPDGDSFITK